VQTALAFAMTLPNQPISIAASVAPPASSNSPPPARSWIARVAPSDSSSSAAEPTMGQCDGAGR
jgi:hypothetical protein